MSENRRTTRYKILSPVTAVKLEAHPGSSLRDPTDTLVNIPANAVVELEGMESSSALATILWNGDAFSVLQEDLKGKAQALETNL